jgi:hypothetical protein
LVYRIKGSIQAEGIYKYSAEEDIEASKKEVTEEWRKVHNEGLRGM